MKTACLLSVLPLLVAGAALGQTAPPEQQITVVGSSPLLGSGVDRNLLPVTTQVLGSTDITRQGAPNALQALNDDVSGVNLDNAAGNPYQPSLFYNGFQASPLQGNPQGLAVYLGGIRFNQAFGDTVNWDLIPDVAIAHINIEGSNPVFGLNALGGAVNIALKNGFANPGGLLTLSGGSFGTLEADLEYGRQSGDQAIYAAGSVRHQNGWRDEQSSDIQNFYGDWGFRRGGTEIHLDAVLANSDLNGPGTAPVQLLAADPQAQFTAPNLQSNRYAQLSAHADTPLGDAQSLQMQAYYSYFLQRIANGNVSNDLPCNDGSGLLCSGPGMPSTTRGGAPIPAFLGAGPYNQLAAQTTNTNAYGGALQFTDAAPLFGLRNHFVAGLSFDGAQTEFSATALVGGLTRLSRDYYGPGVVIDEPGINVPVRVAISDANAGAYATDTLNLTRSLAATVSGRFGFAEVDLHDQGGGDLNGNHPYARLNPAAGLTWRAARWLTLYAGYAEATRAPTPAELSCAGPQNSCSLANFFVGDPNLKQVIAHTVEAGLRGRVALGDAAGLRYDLALFHTDADDDIVFVNSPVLNRAFFQNIGQTRRQGLSARLDVEAGPVSAFVGYTYTEATYQTGFIEAAGNNPAADPNGNITIRPGDQLPGVPRTTVKFGADWDVTEAWHIGGDALLQSGQYLFGDEANLTPKLPGFFTLDLNTSYQVTPRVQLFANAQNVLDRRYYTYGTFAPTSSVYLVQAPGASNPRSYSLAAPIGVFGGVRVRF